MLVQNFIKLRAAVHELSWSHITTSRNLKKRSWKSSHARDMLTWRYRIKIC